MKLPNDTIIAETKITQYLLKFLAEDDKSLFLAQANYTQDNWQQLEKDLREQILPLDATPTEPTRYGNKGLAIKYNPSYPRRVGTKKSDISGCDFCNWDAKNDFE